MQDQPHIIEELQAEIERLRKRVDELEKKEFDTTDNQSLLKSEENLRVTLNSIGDAVITTDLEGKVQQMNPVAQKFTGWTIEQATGKPLNEVFHIVNAQSRLRVNNPVSRVLQTGDIIGLANDTVLISKHGIEYQIADSAAPIRDDRNKIRGVVLVFRDVTAEHSLQEQIRLSEEALRTFIENSLMAVSMTDENGIMEIWNPASEKMTGISKQDAIGKPFYKILREMTLPEKSEQLTEDYYKEAFDKGLKTSKSISKGVREVSFKHKNGDLVTIRQIFIPIKTNKGYRYGTIADDITNLKNAEQQKSASEERFRTLAENLPGVVYLCRNDSTYSMLYLNNAVVDFTGYSNKEFLQNQVNFVELYHPDDKEGIINSVNLALSKKQPFHIVYRLHHKDGSWHWIEEWGSGVWDGDKLLFLEGFMADITNRKQAEEELKESQERFKRLVEHSPDIIYSFSTLRGGSYHSSRVFEVLGYTPEQLKDDPMLWENSIHPDDLEMVVNAVANTAHGHPINMEYRIKSASGEWRWLYDRSMHLLNTKSGILIEGLAIDITERKLTEERLLKSEQNYKKLQELFRNMADIMPDMLWAKDLDKNFIFVNNSICRNLLIAKDTNEPIGKTDMFFATRERELHPENPEWHTFGEICRDSDSIVQETGKTGQFDEFGNVQGKFLFLDVIKTPLRNEKGEIIGVVGTARDITENKHAELKLRESEANLSAIIENSMENIWSINTNYEIQYINAVFAKTFGQSYGIKLSKGVNILEMLPDSVRSIWKKRYDKALCGEQFFFQDKIETQEFSIYIHVAMNPIVVDGLVVGASIFGRDITEQVLAEKKLIEAKEKAEQSDRLKSAFINNITHEIRTPLNGILGFGQMMTETDLPLKERLEYLKLLQSSSNRLMQTVSDFMDISMLTSGNMEKYYSKIYLNTLMDDLLQKTRSLCTRKEIEVSLEVPVKSDDLQIISDRELIRKVMWHLLGNSEKFTLKGFIRFGYDVIDKKLTFFVKDSGSGIAGTNMKIIFDVFMQGDTSITRGYEGSGLGLSIAKGIVQLLGGEIWAESEEGKGTIFYFTLPNPVISAQSRPLQPLSSRNINSDQPLILIAEDDESNYFYIKVVLEKSGYSTIRANNGAEAVKMCRQNHEISMVLMDIKMPEMNGIEATKAIREFLPGLPIIALTAYAQSSDEYHIMEAGCTAYLPKPIKKEELLQLILKISSDSQQLL